MSNIDEELMDTIHKWSVQMRGKIASGDIAEKGIIHSFLERERILKIIVKENWLKLYLSVHSLYQKPLLNLKMTAILQEQKTKTIKGKL